MDRLIWLRGIAGAIAHLLIVAVTLVIGLLIGKGMADLARYLAAWIG
jgi:hypothetical protein